MNSFPQRLAQIMRMEGIASVAKLAEALGYERSERVRKVMSGESLPSYGMLEDIARTFASVDLHWLVTGIVRSNSSLSMAAEPPAPYGKGNDDIIEAAREAARLAAREEVNALMGRKREGPVVAVNATSGANKKD